MKKPFVFVLIHLAFFFHILWFIISLIKQRPAHIEEKRIKAFQERFRRLNRIDARLDTIEEAYLDANGVLLHLDILAYGNGYPSVVFIPGTSVYAQFYLEFMDALHKKGFNVIGFDPRGHGRSSGARGDYTIVEIVDDALAVVEYARRLFGADVAVAGSSQGGIAAFYAASRDDRLSGAICHNIADLNARDNLVLSTLRLPKVFIPAARRFMKLYRRFGIPVSLYLDLKKEHLKDGTDAASYIREDPLCITWITLRAMNSLVYTRLAKPVEQIKVPIMLIHSDKDTIFPRRYVEEIWNRLTCPNKDYLLLKDTEHLAMTNSVSEVAGPAARWLKKIMNR